jgi:hypothetical protein
MTTALRLRLLFVNVFGERTPLRALNFVVANKIFATETVIEVDSTMDCLQNIWHIRRYQPPTLGLSLDADFRLWGAAG